MYAHEPGAGRDKPGESITIEEPAVGKDEARPRIRRQGGCTKSGSGGTVLDWGP